MNLELVNNVLMLNTGDGNHVTFMEEWVKDLQACPLQHYGDFIRKTIYPVWAAEKRKKHTMKFPLLNAKELRAITSQYLKDKE
ncbi:MAG: hypothetical protein JW795_13200 [Chitinivibrionales bacterium]|nr:hypothetical protein [Chitinivibrionales bacterium]